MIEFVATAEYNCYMMSVNELFPTQVRLIGISFVKTIGGSSLMLSGLLISFCMSTGFRIMVVFTGLSVLGMGVVYLLPESYGKMPVEVIEELKENKDNN